MVFIDQFKHKQRLSFLWACTAEQAAPLHRITALCTHVQQQPWSKSPWHAAHHKIHTGIQLLVCVCIFYNWWNSTIAIAANLPANVHESAMLQQEDRQSAHAAKYCRVCTRMQKKSWQRSPGTQQTSKYCEINCALPDQRIGLLPFMRWSCIAWWFHKQMRWPALVYTRSDFIFVWAIDFVYSSPPLADNGSSAWFVSLVNHQKLYGLHTPCSNH